MASSTSSIVVVLAIATIAIAPDMAIHPLGKNDGALDRIPAIEVEWRLSVPWRRHIAILNAFSPVRRLRYG